MKKVLIVVPHLSTGGLPQYTLSLIKKIKDEVDVYCIEYNMIADVFVVQRKQIVNILGDKFYALRGDGNRLISVIEEINPDIIHLQELPEFFIPKDIANSLYNIDRKYIIIETSHDSSFDISNKLYFPDKFALISEYQRKRFSELKIPITILEADIEYKKRVDRTDGLKKLGLDPNLKHILNVGLFTPRKNQAEIFDYAKSMIDHPVQFHFIGNQAGNFQDYWKPLMDDCPNNVKIWGERSDVDDFYSCMDLFLFTSRGTNNDKETSPLVIREAIGHGIPSLIYNLPVYMNMYDKYDSVHYLDFENLHENTKNICKMVGLTYDKEFIKPELFSFVFHSSENKIEINYKDTPRLDTKVSIRDIDSKVPIYWFDAVFYDNNSYWTIPVPKKVYDFILDDTFRGFEIEFYNLNDELIYSKEFYIKDIPKKRNTVLNVSNPFDCLFFNYNEMFVNGNYDCYGIKGIDCVLDIGANNGLFTLYLLNNGCKNVYAFEPNTSAIQNMHSILNKHIDYEIVETAIYINDENLTFYITENNSTIGSISKDHVNKHAGNGIPKEIIVPSMSLKSFTKEKSLNKIGLIKMDIEGAEYDIIENLEEEIFEITDAFLIEFHQNDNGQAKRMIEKIVSNGFEVNQIRKQSSVENYDITNSYENSIDGTVYLKKIKNHTNTLVKKTYDRISCATKRDLASLVNNMYPNGIGVEIGVLRGDYSKMILEEWKNGKLYLVDTWRHISEYIDMNGRNDEYHYECMIQTAKNIKPYQDRANMIRMGSVDASKLFPDEYFDFIYIDADHSYEAVKKDLEVWWPKIKRGGIFSGDDFIPEDGDIWLVNNSDGSSQYAGKFGVRKAVTEFSNKNGLKIYSTTEEPYWKQWYTFKPF